MGPYFTHRCAVAPRGRERFPAAAAPSSCGCGTQGSWLPPWGSRLPPWGSSWLPSQSWSCAVVQTRVGKVPAGAPRRRQEVGDARGGVEHPRVLLCWQRVGVLGASWGRRVLWEWWGEHSCSAPAQHPPGWMRAVSLCLDATLGTLAGHPAWMPPKSGESGARLGAGSRTRAT